MNYIVINWAMDEYYGPFPSEDEAVAWAEKWWDCLREEMDDVGIYALIAPVRSNNTPISLADFIAERETI